LATQVLLVHLELQAYVVRLEDQEVLVTQVSQDPQVSQEELELLECRVGLGILVPVELMV